MFSVLFGLWLTMWAVFAATLPIHLILHGMLAWRIAQTEGWRELRQHYRRVLVADSALLRWMMIWLLVTFAEVLLILLLSVLLVVTG